MVSAASDVEVHGIEAGEEEGRRPSRGLRIAIVASGALELFPEALYEFLMDGLPRGSTILLRRGNKRAPGAFERTVREILDTYAEHLKLRWELPDPEGGAGATFNRDNDMVAKADLVLAFFAPDQLMTGGTGHVVETAIDRSVPVYSFAVGDALTWVGSHDPDALWQESIGAFFAE